MNESQLDQLRDALRHESRHINPVGAGADAVRRRGRRRRNRGRTVVAVGAATCVAGLGVSLVERGSGNPQSLAVAAQSGAAATTPTLEFRVVSGTVSDSMQHFTTAAGVTYELSTAPGIAAAGAQPAQAIYSTSDGESWTTAKQSNSWISDLTEHDGVLYAVGTAPGGTVDNVQYQLATSRDGGNAWSDTDLPFDLSPPTATVPISRTSSVVVATGATQTVALLSENFTPDLSALVAARAAGHPDAQTRMTSAGYDIVDMSSCLSEATGIAAKTPASAAIEKVRAAGECNDAPVIGKISWSDIGLSGAADLTHQELLVSTDGSKWNSVPAPTTGSVTNLVATDDGFLLLAQNNNTVSSSESPGITTTLLHSSDARTWTQVNTPAGLNVQAIANDSIVGTDASGAVETSTDGGTTWNTTGVTSLLPAGAPGMVTAGADVGPLGFAVLETPEPSAGTPASNRDYLLFSTDGINWTTTDLGSVGEPADGYPMQVTVGEDHVSVDYSGAVTTAGATMPITTLLGTPKR